MPGVELDHQLAAPKLRHQPPQPRFVVSGRRTPGQLLTKLFSQAFFKPHRELIADTGVVLAQAEQLSKFVFGGALHSDKEAAAVFFRAGPRLDTPV